MEKLTYPTSDFGFEILRKWKSSSNMLLSPVSISTALLMLSAGANNETKGQLLTALKLNQTSEPEILQYQKELFLLLKKPMDSKCETRLANGIFSDQHFKVKESYAQSVINNFNAEIRLVDFKGDPAKCIKDINDWVEEKTLGKISDLLSQNSVTCSTEMILVNAIHFKGKWSYPFEESYTRNGSFHLNKNEIIKVPMMNAEEKYSLIEYEDLNCRCLSLPYCGDSFCCLIILPNRIDGLEKLEDEMNGSHFFDMIGRIKTCFNSTVKISLPKFKIKVAMDLKGLLQLMGVKDVFMPRMADLSGISDADVYVSDAVHQACIEVSEEGTEAAAATAIMVNSYCLVFPQEFTVDRPFMIVIYDEANNSPLFMGSICNPATN